jgi:FkbM family methyltransferase
MKADAFVQEIYRLALGREADAAGLAGWVKMIEDGANPMQVLAGILASDEYQRRPVVADGEELIRGILDRLRGHTVTIVDVGAQELASEQHVYHPLCELGFPHRIIGFEPLAEKRAERASADHGGTLTMLPDAIGDGEQHTLFVNNDDATSSLYELDQAFCADFDGLRSLHPVRRLDIRTRRLDDVLSGIKSPIDFLKLDIQGGELMALRGASSTLARTAVIHCEVEFSGLYKSQPLFPEIQILLNRHEFDLIDILVQHRYSYVVPSGKRSGDRLIWADAVFFRRADDVLTLLSQALMAQVVYRKASLAEHLLAKVVSK